MGESLPAVLDAEENCEYEDRVPLALDAFAGRNAPVGCALLMLGWQVELLEWELNSADDIRKPEKQEEFGRYA